METKFDFQDLCITLCGVNFEGALLSGTASLEGDDDGFDVTLIELADGPVLRKCNANFHGGMRFEDEFFSRIAAVIQNPKTAVGRLAEATWIELREDAGTVDHSAPYSTINISQQGITTPIARV